MTTPYELASSSDLHGLPPTAPTSRNLHTGRSAQATLYGVLQPTRAGTFAVLRGLRMAFSIVA
jgi:hypothetical protein